MTTGRQRADHLVERIFGKVQVDPLPREEPAKPQSVADRLKGIQESRHKTLVIMRKMNRF